MKKVMTMVWLRVQHQLLVLPEVRYDLAIQPPRKQIQVSIALHESCIWSNWVMARVTVTCLFIPLSCSGSRRANEENLVEAFGMYKASKGIISRPYSVGYPDHASTSCEGKWFKCVSSCRGFWGYDYFANKWYWIFRWNWSRIMGKFFDFLVIDELFSDSYLLIMCLPEKQKVLFLHQEAFSWRYL